jgi:hypothetical protein
MPKEFVAFTRLDASDVNTFLVNNGELREILYFTSSGTFTKATYPWLNAIRVRVQGAGGGSGGCATTSTGQISAGGAGAGGGYAEKFITDIAGLASSVTVTVGAGGAGGAAGNNAGSAGNNTTAFGLTGNGGGGGFGSAAAAFASFFPVTATGGSGTGGDINISGGDNTLPVALNADRVIPSVSGASVLGKSIGGSIADSGGRNAFVGKTFGGGASGPALGAGGTQRAGAAGGAGIVIVELYA